MKSAINYGLLLTSILMGFSQSWLMLIALIVVAIILFWLSWRQHYSEMQRLNKRLADAQTKLALPQAQRAGDSQKTICKHG